MNDALATIEAIGDGENGRYITALTFGNVHGVYKPGGVKLRPEILKDIQAQVGARIGEDNPFDLVFHGGSGSSDQEIADAVSYGVIKMNIDTDTQYAHTRPAADHRAMASSYNSFALVTISLPTAPTGACPRPHWTRGKALTSLLLWPS